MLAIASCRVVMLADAMSARCSARLLITIFLFDHRLDTKSLQSHRNLVQLF
jgi:hypothetical protein